MQKLSFLLGKPIVVGYQHFRNPLVDFKGFHVVLYAIVPWESCGPRPDRWLATPQKLAICFVRGHDKPRRMGVAIAIFWGGILYGYLWNPKETSIFWRAGSPPPNKGPPTFNEKKGPHLGGQVYIDWELGMDILLETTIFRGEHVSFMKGN